MKEQHELEGGFRWLRMFIRNFLMCYGKVLSLTFLGCYCLSFLFIKRFLFLMVDLGVFICSDALLALGSSSGVYLVILCSSFHQKWSVIFK